MKYLLALFAVAAAVVVGLAWMDRHATQVLMVGNSHTYGNDLGGMIESLAESGGHDVRVTTVAVGGWWLRDHAASPNTIGAIESGEWDYVVLQEQSVVPSYPPEATGTMFPAVRALDRSIRGAGALPMLFLTWGRANGFLDSGHANYGSMQAAITESYESIAVEVAAVIAPVGEAWQTVRVNHPGVDLYLSDGNHPTSTGTYLAACVFYATILGESPEGLEYHAGLSSGTASTLQQIAAQTVLDDPMRWHLPTAPGGSS